MRPRDHGRVAFGISHVWQAHSYQLHQTFVRVTAFHLHHFVHQLVLCGGHILLGGEAFDGHVQAFACVIQWGGVASGVDDAKTAATNLSAKRNVRVFDTKAHALAGGSGSAGRRNTWSSKGSYGVASSSLMERWPALSY